MPFKAWVLSQANSHSTSYKFHIIKNLTSPLLPYNKVLYHPLYQHLWLSQLNSGTMHATPGENMLRKLHYKYLSMWTPLQISEFDYSATPVADRCIKSSTHPCNLHRQTLLVEWPY